MDVRSIDKIAGGYIRYQFIRSFVTSASALLLAGALILSLLGPLNSYLTDPYWRPSWNMHPLLEVALQTLASVLFGVLIVAVVSTFYIGQYYWTHRRFTALFMLWWSIVLISLVEPEMAAAGDPRFAWHTRLLLAIRPVVLVIVLFELLAYVWWQFRISRADFLAARGWRPSVWQTWTSLSRNLGLPAFITSVGRGRYFLTFLYFLVAIVSGAWLAFLIDVRPNSAIETIVTPQLSITLLSQGYALLLLAVALNLLGLPRLVKRIADTQAIKAYQPVREWDTRAPIVFLRQFDQDAVKLRAGGFDPFLALPSEANWPRAIDELLLEHASPYGPVIAIGDPRTQLPPLGAARIFVPGDGRDWQETVLALIDASKGVVMCPASSEGVRWEMDLLSRRYANAWAIYLASPEARDADSMKLLEECIKPESPIALPKGQLPIVAYQDVVPGRWVLLTSRKRTIGSYTIALNLALQATFGIEGVPLPQLAKVHSRQVRAES